MKNTKNKHRVAAFLYAFYAFTYCVVIVASLYFLGWHGFDRLVDDFKLIVSSMAPLGILTVINIIMASLSWNFLDIPKKIKILTIGIALLLVALPTFGLISSLVNEGIAKFQLVSIMIIVIYSTPAFSLTKDMISNHIIKRTE